MARKPTYEELEERVEALAREIEKHKQMEAQSLEMHRLAISLGATDNLEEGLRLCLRAAVKMAGLDCGGVYLLDRHSLKTGQRGSFSVKRR